VEDRSQFNLVAKTLSKRLPYNPNRIFNAVSTFYYSDIDEKGNEYLECVVRRLNDIKALNGQEVVEKIELNAPFSFLNEQVIVLYGRSVLSGYTPDYIYPNIERRDNRFNVNMPCSCTVTFNKNFIPTGLSEDDFILYIANANGAAFSTLRVSDAKIENTLHELKWTFPEAWNCWLDVSTFNSDNVVDFHCNLEVIVNGSIPVPIVIDSRDGVVEYSDASTCLAQKIHLWWGCFGKDTKVVIDGGREKFVYEVNPGDRVLTAQGEYRAVKSVVRGKEDEMIYVQTYSEKELTLTTSHPVLTRRGFVPAGELNAADMLKTDEGFEGLLSLNKISYDDYAYNLMFESEQAIVANHFVVGDLAMQQSGNASREQAREQARERSPELSAVQKDLRREMKALMKELNESGGADEIVKK
jgi:hypothetical protein